MHIKGLRQLLLSKHVPPDAYSLEGGLPNEAFCIERNGKKWHLYYSERGRKSTINYYENEDEVVSAFLTLIERDML